MTIEEKAKEIAMNNFNKWNDVANVVERDTGYYYELESIIEDTVQIAISEAMRWRDPKEDLPDQTGLVLTKMGDDVNSVDICHFINGRFKLYYQNQPSDYTVKPIFREDLTDAIIGWRPIK